MTAGCLRFLDASRVASPAGTLADLELCSRDNRPVGRLEGVLIDPSARRVRYFVVKSPGRQRRYLLTADTPLHVELAPRRGRVESAHADLKLEPFDPDSVLPFSADDAVTAMFAEPAA
jgi:hypothetical protein